LNKANPAELEGLISQSLAFLKTKEYAKAEKLLDRALRLAPENEEVQFLLIRCHDGSNDLSQTKTLAKAFMKKFPTGQFYARAEQILTGIKEKEKRLALGGDITARFKTIGKPSVEVTGYSVYLCPSDVPDLTQQSFAQIWGNRSFQNVHLEPGTKLRVIKSASISRSQQSIRRGQKPVFDAAYVEVTSGREKGTSGWVKLELVSYSDVGPASDPFAFPLAVPEAEVKP
jgi:hypothetical protein